MTERSDQETAELVLAWLREYGLAIILGVIVAVAGNYAYHAYQNHHIQKQREASAALMALSDALQKQDQTQIEAKYQKLNGSDLEDIAHLLLAQHHIQQKRLDEALPLLQKSQSSKDIWVAQTSQKKQIEMNIVQKQYDSALKAIEALRGGIYNEDIPFLQGLVYEQQGQYEQALLAYSGMSESHAKVFKINALKALILTRKEKQS